MRNVFNFNPGPAILPEPVLESTSKAILNFANTGMSIMEVSHRSKDFDALLIETEALLERAGDQVHRHRNDHVDDGAEEAGEQTDQRTVTHGDGLRRARLEYVGGQETARDQPGAAAAVAEGDTGKGRKHAHDQPAHQGRFQHRQNHLKEYARFPGPQGTRRLYLSTIQIYQRRRHRCIEENKE